MTLDKLPNTGQAVIIDIGEANDIHPRDKQDVAKRLARWALADTYGRKIAHDSPRYESMERRATRSSVRFRNVDGKLDTFDNKPAAGFAIAGSDRKWVWADAKIVGDNEVEVRSDAVPEPVAVRYAWADNPVVQSLRLGQAARHAVPHRRVAGHHGKRSVSSRRTQPVSVE